MTATAMDPTFQQKLNAMIAASNGRLWIVSGYRSNAEQTDLWNQAVKRYGEANAGKWVARPGHSNHERGVAADLGGDLELAHQLAPTFGLSFPMDWEAWHVEPVGARTAAAREAYTDWPGAANPVDKDMSFDPAYQVALLADAFATNESQLSSHWLLDSSDMAAVASPTGNSSTGAATGGGNVSPEQVYAALRAHGVDPSHAAALTAIAGRESGYNVGAYNGNRDTGDDSHGLFQINLLNGGWGPFLKAQGIDPSKLNTLEGSAAAAAAIVNHSGLHPWGGYKGDPWSKNVDVNTGVTASGGEVTLDQLQGLR